MIKDLVAFSRKSCKISVRFDNEDGTSRQMNLKQLYPIYNDLYNVGKKAEAQYKPFEYEAEPALMVVINSLEIGNVPTDCVKAFREEILYGELTACYPSIKKFKNNDGHFMYICEVTQHYIIK